MSLQQFIASFCLGGIEEALASRRLFARPYVWIWPLWDCVQGEWEGDS